MEVKTAIDRDGEILISGWKLSCTEQCFGTDEVCYGGCFKSSVRYFISKQAMLKWIKKNWSIVAQEKYTWKAEHEIYSAWSEGTQWTSGSYNTYDVQAVINKIRDKREEILAADIEEECND